MINRRTPSLVVLGCLLVASLGSCGPGGFGTARGSPYDFSQLEPVAEPVLRLPDLEVVNRQEFGTDCRAMSCERPYLTYTLRPKIQAGCELVQKVISAFREVTSPFSPSGGWCGYNGEVQGRGVSVGGDLTEGGGALPADGGDVLAGVRIAVFADGLGRPYRRAP